MDGKDLTKKEQNMVESTRNVRQAAPLVDIYENEDEILLHAEMPGVQKDDISINIDNGRLTVSGVRMLEKVGAAEWEEFGDVEYQRAFSVPQTIDVNKVNAELKDGILALHLPKSEAAKPKSIEIKAA
ncbi:MAG: Hsp20/alpha crystallin family protein [Desulfobacterales bacterium]|nr:Hsp20/alpha crystallin family protein [Deltaproteobacteria bacterium]MBT8362403.1 Hsp20/alpha crystallin family protein [Deltaproteobacteria bacterium]NNK93909.1 Hsp20/alpha crystallin family protein [Desulfobacterales bacterium]